MKELVVLVLAISMIFNIIGCEQRKDAGGKVVAQINGREIRDDEFKMRFSRLTPALKSKYSDEKGKREFLEEIIKRELLLQEARKAGIEKDQVLLYKIEEMRERLILNEFLQREVEGKLVTTDKELEDYYNLHKEEFKSPDEAKISHILVKNEEDAKAVIKRLRKGSDFAKMAREISIDMATKDSGGEMGVIQKGKFHPQLDSVIFSANEGDVSDPVKTERGYHIIKVQKKIPGLPLSFNDAKNILSQRYQIEKRSKVFEDLFTRLKSKANITISDENLKKTEADNVHPE
ncbi:MAG TPA: peptidyl-prolyl cis-trans isomerase [Nitrospiria bacterium]|nr:peptidyl-prolyl cis-trans isomerase [Nitrospiria bacterium]